MAQAQAILTDINRHHAPVEMGQQPVDIRLQLSHRLRRRQRMGLRQRGAHLTQEGLAFQLAGII